VLTHRSLQAVSGRPFLSTVAGLIVAYSRHRGLLCYRRADRTRCARRCVDVSIQILALEDEFKRNEKELKRQEAVKREIEMRELEDRVKNAASTGRFHSAEQQHASFTESPLQLVLELCFSLLL